MPRILTISLVSIPTYVLFLWLAHQVGDEVWVFFLGWAAGTIALVLHTFFLRIMPIMRARLT